MPSESRRRKDDTWTSEELDKALKGTKDDMLRKKRRDDEGDHRRHAEVNGSGSRHKDGEKDRHRSKSHKDRGDSPERRLTEEERERQRAERRAKRDGGKEEKKSKPKESSKPQKIIDSDDEDDRKRRHHRDKEHDRDRDKRHKDRDSEKDRHHKDRDGEKRHHRDRGDEDRGGSRRHKEDREERREKDKDREHRRKDDGDREHRRHNDDKSDRRKKRDEESDRHKDKHEETEEEKEKRRQERREKREREKEAEKDKERSSHRRSERKKGDEDDRESHGRHRGSDRDRDRDRDKDKHKDEEKPQVSRHTSNGRHRAEEEKNEEEDDDYNYEEDFEDYEDDFEDEEDPQMNEEGEMEEVLRALDEENNRLASTSQRSNWSDSTELSDERFKDDEHVSRAAPRQKTFINFISAKQRVMDNTVAGRVRKRFEDLSKLIELDVMAFDMFDLPPVKEYELYIRSFGRSDTKQAYVQTRDDDVDRDIQTEEIECLSKWTQHPADEETVVGGEGINVQSSAKDSDLVKHADPVKLNEFVDRVSQWLFTVLEEESGDADSEERRERQSQPTASFSEGTSRLGSPNFLAGRQVLDLTFCSADPNSLLSVHSSPVDDAQHTEDLSTIRASSPVEQEKTALINKFSLICVWNLAQPTYPYRICGSDMQITCACFSPTKASLVFGGMRDGSVGLWDLREPASMHHSHELDGQKHLVRFATYNTAGVSECHQSPVVSIAAVYSGIVGSLKDEEMIESSSGLSFQLASVEEKALVNLWVVAEIAVPEVAGSMHDLGLSPGGRIKIMKSSCISVNNPSRYLSTSAEVKALDMQLNPGDLNHFYVGTDAGHVVHGVRFGKRVYPQSHSSLVGSPVPIVSIDFSPFGQPYFLAGCKDGTLHLFNTKIENPIATWREFASGESILSVRWSKSRPAVFFVLDNSSTVFTFDLVENGLTPIRTDRITKADATRMELGGDPNLLTPGVNRPAYMVLSLDDGSTELISVSQPLREQQPLEEEFLGTYVDRY